MTPHPHGNWVEKDIINPQLGSLLLPPLAAVSASFDTQMASEAAEGRSYWGMTARGCESCKAAPALLFCRADSAFLCGACDAKVHGSNKLASRHGRVWMCEVCEQAPATVTCKADAAALCVSCDADIHSANPLARRHERVPVQPFFDFLPKPPAIDLCCNAEEKDVDDDDDNDNDDNEDDSDDNNDNEERKYWLQQHPKPHAPDGQHISPFSDVDPYLDLDYAASLDAGFHHMDSVVPVQNRPAVGIHHVPGSFYDAPDRGSYDFDYSKSKAAMYTYAPSLSHSVSSSEVGVVPDASAMGEISNRYVTGVPVSPASFLGHSVSVAVVGTDREARVMRYREKRKNRKFEKTIRYASRKAYAETRPRVKGRFAKRTEMDGAGYGVVPSF